MILPTWLYSKDGKSTIARTEDELNDLLNKGWKDSPDRFKIKEEQPKPNQGKKK